MIALVSRGYCTFVSKAQRAMDAGAIGIVLADNRAGEANGIPIRLQIPVESLSDPEEELMRTIPRDRMPTAMVPQNAPVPRTVSDPR